VADVLGKKERGALCDICSLPSDRSPCSERCRRLRPVKRRVLERSDEVDRLLLEAVPRSKALGTACPGLLARAVLMRLGLATLDERDSLAVVRSNYRQLRERGAIRFYQKGVPVPRARWPKGPFRVGA
jgi:hypothetical protein